MSSVGVGAKQSLSLFTRAGRCANWQSECMRWLAGQSIEAPWSLPTHAVHMAKNPKYRKSAPTHLRRSTDPPGETLTVVFKSSRATTRGSSGIRIRPFSGCPPYEIFSDIFYALIRNHFCAMWTSFEWKAQHPGVPRRRKQVRVP
jgi:hypothetical protein